MEIKLHPFAFRSTGMLTADYDSSMTGGLGSVNSSRFKTQPVVTAKQKKHAPWYDPLNRASENN
ncbi:MAG: hypothetical protein U0941_08195 [Planctomycetaceae bacterium]